MQRPTCVDPSSALRVESYTISLLKANAICSTNSSSSFFSPINKKSVLTCGRRRQKSRAASSSFVHIAHLVVAPPVLLQAPTSVPDPCTQSTSPTREHLQLRPHVSVHNSASCPGQHPTLFILQPNDLPAQPSAPPGCDSTSKGQAKNTASYPASAPGERKLRWLVPSSVPPGASAPAQQGARTSPDSTSIGAVPSLASTPTNMTTSSRMSSSTAQ